MGEDLFMRCKGWATLVFNSKTTTNVEAKSQINYLEQYRVDTDNGVFNFTTVEGVLPAQMQSHFAVVESAEAWRAEQDEQPQFASAPPLGRGGAFGVWLSTESFVAFVQVAKVMERHSAVLFLLVNQVESGRETGRSVLEQG